MQATSYTTRRLAALPLLALLAMVPVTLPVPVLRELVQQRFAVSELLTSLFMSVNMIGATLAAPLAGALADRFGRRPDWIVAALLADALCFFGLTRDVSFAVFLGVRFLEGCAHIFALSLLLSLAAGARAPEQRGRVMGLAGGGLLLGVALGAPLGGAFGRGAALWPFYLGSALLVGAALLARLTLVETEAEARRPALREMLRLLRSSPLLAVPLAFAFAERFTVGFFTTTFPLYLGRIHALPPARIGLLIAVFMLPFALLSYAFGRLAERVSPALLLCGGSLLYGIGTASLTLWSPAALPLFMASLGAAAAVMFVPSLLMTTEFAPGALRSTAIGAFNAAGSLGFIVGPLTGGLVSQGVAAQAGWEAGYGAAFAVAGGSEILLALLCYPALRRAGRGRAAGGAKLSGQARRARSEPQASEVHRDAPER